MKKNEYSPENRISKQAEKINLLPFLNVIKSQCPFIEDPSDECYCLNMSSQKIEAAIYFCGGNFDTCAIYKYKMLDRE